MNVELLTKRHYINVKHKILNLIRIHLSLIYLLAKSLTAFQRKFSFYHDYTETLHLLNNKFTILTRIDTTLLGIKANDRNFFNPKLNFD